MKFQMLFEIESCLEQSQQTETLTCNFHPESENVVGLEWDLGSQLINLLKVLFFLSGTKLYQNLKKKKKMFCFKDFFNENLHYLQNKLRI